MEVDMSPRAVKQRLELMGELCDLSAKLMNSRKIEPDKKADGLSNHPGDQIPPPKKS